MSADNWRTLNQLTADPVFRRGATLPLALGWLDRAVTVADDAVGLRARRHDARHRLALPVDRPAHRAAGARCAARCRWRSQRRPCQRPRLAARARRLHRHLPLALPGRARVAAGARPAGARRDQPALGGVPGRRAWSSTSTSSSACTAASRATCWRRRMPRCARLTPADLHPESAALADAARRSCSAPRAALSDELTLKFFSHAESRSVLSAGVPEPARCPHDAPTTLHRRARDPLRLRRAGVAVVAARPPDAAHAAVAAAAVARARRSSPRADERHDALDSFGNTVTHFGLHARAPRCCACACSARSRSATAPADRRGAERARPLGGSVARRGAHRVGATEHDDLLPARMCEPTRLVPLSEGARAPTRAESLRAAAATGWRR